MTARRTRGDAVDRAAQGIDRMLSNVQTGRFERSLSTLTAAGALVTTAEIYFEHDSARFGNKMMWLPVGSAVGGRQCGLPGSRATWEPSQPPYRSGRHLRPGARGSAVTGPQVPLVTGRQPTARTRAWHRGAVSGGERAGAQTIGGRTRW